MTPCINDYLLRTSYYAVAIPPGTLHLLYNSIYNQVQYLNLGKGYAASIYSPMCRDTSRVLILPSQGGSAYWCEEVSVQEELALDVYCDKGLELGVQFGYDSLCYHGTEPQRRMLSKSDT